VQTTGRRTHHSWPALYCALLLTAGIVPAYGWIDLPPLPTHLPVFVALLAACVVLSALWLSGAGSVWHSCLMTSCVIACGFVLGWEAHLASAVFSKEVVHGPVTVAGVVADQPMHTGNRLRFRMHASRVISDSLALDTRWDLVVSLSITGCHPDSVPAFGDAIVLRGVIQPPRGARNPGEFDEGSYYHANGIDGMCIVRKPRQFLILARDEGWSMTRHIVIPLREGLRRHIDVTIGGQEGEFLKGLMIGDRGGLSPAVKDAFMVAGVAHVLAVSGGNVAVVAAALVVLLLLVRLPRVLFPVPLTTGLILYMLISGSQPSVVRATIMALVILAVSYRGWRGSGLNAVGLAALVMFAMDVRQLFDAGFMLSFGAVLSILLLYPRTDALIGAWKRDTRAARMIRGALRLAAVSAVSSVGTLPLTAVQFGRMSVVGLLANIPVVPVTGWSVVLGLCSAGAGFVAPWASASLAALNALLLRLTLWFVSFCAMLPGASVDLFWFTPAFALPLLALLGVWYHWRDAVERKFWMLGAVAAGVLVVWLPADHAAGAPGVRVSFIDVGQGDATLIEHPGGGALLIDTGPLPADVRSGIVPFLLRRGIRTLDAVIITHPHDDHNGGLRAVCSTFTVGRIVTGATHTAGDTILWREDCRLQVLSGPATADTALLRRTNANRQSVVVRLVYGTTAFMFAADAEGPEEERIVQAFGNGLRADVLKVGHHGSAAGTTDAWLNAVDPSTAVISVGRMNRFGHPASPTMSRLALHGVHVLRTDIDGAVLMATDGAAVQIVSWR
jgi:competence protein ComEC